MNIATEWFKMERIDDGVTLLYEPYVNRIIRCNIWHVRGRDSDLLLDTGTGIASLRAAAAHLFDKKLLVVLTHTHFDHVGGAYEFDSRILHQLEAEGLERPLLGASLRKADFPSELIEGLAAAGYTIDGEELVSAYPFEGYDSALYSVRSAAPTRLVEHGDVVDLGDRSFEVLHAPGHTPGSIGLWDSKGGVLFSGDAIYDGPLVDDLPGSDIDDYIRTMEMLRELPVATVHPGHEGSFGRRRMVELIDLYLERRRK